MKITILNGDVSKKKNIFSDSIRKLEGELSKFHELKVFHLAEMNLHYCNGCWTCWVKTPGVCAIKDDAPQIFESIINSDFFFFASPLKAGFTTSTLKMITDRLIVLLHPYIEIREGESHHHKRYEQYPDFGLIIQKEQDTDEEDISIINDIYHRFAINFHNHHRFLRFIDEERLAEKIDNIISKN